MRLDLPMCKRIREDLLGGVAFPLLSANVMHGVLSKRLHQSDGGADLYVGNDEGDAVFKFYETLAERYGYTIRSLKREEQVAYEESLKSGAHPRLHTGHGKSRAHFPAYFSHHDQEEFL
jgi:hypothetical protein